MICKRLLYFKECIMNREQFERLKKFIDENNLEEKIDKAFCELNDLICLGSNDEGQTNYNLDDYWNFAYGFVCGYKKQKS